MRSQAAVYAVCIIASAVAATAQQQASNTTAAPNSTQPHQGRYDKPWPNTIWHDIKWYWLHPFWDWPAWKDLFGGGNGGGSAQPNSTNPVSPYIPTPSGCKNSATNRGCWSVGYNINTDFYASWPDTGVTRSYSLSITNSTGAPDGVEREMLLINGGYPGPTIYANWGDYVEVAVTNYLQDNGTGIHFHGIRQWYTNAEDGVPGITECPIAPGHTKVYRWQATQYGTSWYHSHWGVQYGDGILGSIVIDGPSTENYDEDLGTLPVTDWYYQTSSARSAIISHTFGRPPTIADNGLINGTMVSANGTSGSYAVTNITKGKKYRLRLINQSSDNSFMFSLDNHPFTVIAADLSPVRPYTADWIFITVGQRYDVVFEADQDIDNYWFRAEAQDQPRPDCGRNANNGNIRSIFRYKGAPVANPTSQGTSYTQRCSDEVVTAYQNGSVPEEPLKQYGQLDTAIHFGVNNLNSTVVKWGLDTIPIHVAWDKPTLQYVWEGNNSFPDAANVIAVPNEGEYSYWIVQEVPGDPISVSIPHPIHLHGHDFFVLGQGVGNFSDTAGATLNFANPMRRDTAMMPAAGWLAVAFIVDNPGMGVQFLEMAANISEIAPPVYSFDETCGSWSDYYPEHAAYLRDADDSGI
ncbi:laccase, multicopper oxidase, benzenediol:oxygen oxidorectuctase [Saxophila tyrrhenica]|uniref:laccase n=1 Tax=Saxophila tyrrhenica TaxID=1690608 RepID=A0AAV9PPK3_9PEZI|nr:laccase, multicopper oxidase, benzenediol:oxygen oxidorectuctase [Saxophila tyrrhenica]